MCALGRAMGIGNIAVIIERWFREGADPLRELVQNGLEAGADRIEIGPEWEGVVKHKVYRLKVADNGRGMGSAEMVSYLSSLGLDSGPKAVGGVHDNFGIGARIACLPWNQHGMVILSWSEEEPEGAMVWLHKDDVSGEYGLLTLEDGDGIEAEVARPGVYAGIDWAAVKPKMIDQHGTVIVLLGPSGNEDTYWGLDHVLDGNKPSVNLAVVKPLNNRYWQFPGAEVWTEQIQQAARSTWPTDSADRKDSNGKDKVHWRQVQASQHYVEVLGRQTYKIEAKGKLTFSDRTVCHWYLYDGKPEGGGVGGCLHGRVAVRYRTELFYPASNSTLRNDFGLLFGAVANRVVLVLEPKELDEHTQLGVCPGSSRRGLSYFAGGSIPSELPWADWGAEFVADTPAPIQQAVDAELMRKSTNLDLDEALKDFVVSDYLPSINILVAVHAGDGKDPVKGKEGRRVQPNGTGGTGGNGSNTKDEALRLDKGTGKGTFPAKDKTGPKISWQSGDMVAGLVEGRSPNEIGAKWHAMSKTVFMNQDFPFIEEMVRLLQPGTSSGLVAATRSAVKLALQRHMSAQVAYLLRLQKYNRALSQAALTPDALTASMLNPVGIRRFALDRISQYKAKAKKEETAPHAPEVTAVPPADQ